MPVTSSLVSVNGSGIFSSASSFVTNSISSNYIEVDGCSSYSELALNGSITISKITNKATTGSSGSFSLTLYSIVGSVYYKIA
jgi:hypothetical protein